MSSPTIRRPRALDQQDGPACNFRATGNRVVAGRFDVRVVMARPWRGVPAPSFNELARELRPVSLTDQCAPRNPNVGGVFSPEAEMTIPLASSRETAPRSAFARRIKRAEQSNGALGPGSE